jgi:putative Mn2+ efflux pump MntP
LDFLSVLFIAVALAMDAFSVSLASGCVLETVSFRPTFRLAFHFGLFQFLMPILGWLAGTSVVSYIAGYDHWLAFGLLVFVGGRMIRSALDPEHAAFTSDPSRGMTLVILSVATSIDALAVGLSLAVLRIGIWYPSLVIGIVAAAFSVAGVHLGCRLSRVFGKRVELLGGAILIFIGLRVLATHLLGG